MRKDTTPPEKRLADNMLDYNPASTEALVQLMWGALLPGREGGLLNARLRYFDPVRQRAGVPDDVAALVSEFSATHTTVTLVNLNRTAARTVIVQGGAYGEHQLLSVTSGGRTTADRCSRGDRATRSRERRAHRLRDGSIPQRADGASSLAAPVGVKVTARAMSSHWRPGAGEA